MTNRADVVASRDRVANTGNRRRAGRLPAARRDQRPLSRRSRRPGQPLPYWTAFPVQCRADAAATWIRDTGPFARIPALFNHGVRSTGLAGIERWQAMIESGQAPGLLLGQCPHAYPADFAALTHATSALRRLPDGPPWADLPIARLASLGTPGTAADDSATESDVLP